MVLGKEREERVREQMEHPSSPHMLHVVRRVKPLKGRPWWEKQIMEDDHDRISSLTRTPHYLSTINHASVL